MEKLKKVTIHTLAEDYSGSGETRCLAQHGISFYIKLDYDNNLTRRIIFDTGDYYEPILFNAKKLGISLSEADAIVLSHSHYDHTGGLIDLVKNINKKNISVIAHPNVFKKSFYPDNPEKNIGMENEYTKDIVEQYGGVWTLTKTPHHVIDNVYFIGEVPRLTEYERDLTIKLKTLENGNLTDDKIEDDSALYIDTPKGLIVISGCSHSGIINIVNYAKAIKNNEKVYSVIDGFHLLSASETRINNTIKAFKDLGVDNIMTGHCTGLTAEYKIQEEYKDNFQKLHAGKVIEFSF